MSHAVLQIKIRCSASGGLCQLDELDLNCENRPISPDGSAMLCKMLVEFKLKRHPVYGRLIFFHKMQKI